MVVGLNGERINTRKEYGQTTLEGVSFDNYSEKSDSSRSIGRSDTDVDKRYWTTEAKCAWLACAIDGEGSIQFNYGYGRNKNSYQAAIRVMNTNTDFLEKVKDIVKGGTYYKVKAKDPNPRAKDKYVYVSVGNVAMRIIYLVMPYLVIKKERAVLLKEALYILRQGRGGVGVSYQGRIKLEEIYEKMKVLNKRGIPNSQLEL